MKSIGHCIRQLGALLGTDDLNEWEREFVQSIADQSNEGNNTSALTIKQVETIEKLYSRHFGD